MKNYHEMTDYEINVRVATLLGESPWVTQCINFGGTKSSVPIGFGNCMHNVDYCNNPYDAWPIMLENKISLHMEELEEIAYHGVYYDEISGSVDHYEFSADAGSNPLRAAMIVFLMIKDKEKLNEESY